MITKERELINLKAGVPYNVFPKGGVNYYSTEINLQCAKSNYGKQITVSFKSENGFSVSQAHALNELPNFIWKGGLEYNLEPEFGYVVLLSGEDLQVGIMVEEPEGVLGL